MLWITTSSLQIEGEEKEEACDGNNGANEFALNYNLFWFLHFVFSFSVSFLFEMFYYSDALHKKDGNAFHFTHFTLR